MGVRERRDREKEAVRGAILGAARALFVRDGYANVSIRKIAGRIEYSPAAIYGYFTSKDDIFYALAEQGFHLFHRAMTAGHLPDDPVEALRERLWRFYRFSKSQPEYFSLMFVDRSVPRISRDWDRLAFMRDMRGTVEGLVVRAVECGAFPRGTDPGAVFHILATAVHGAAVIRLSDRFCPRPSVDALARDMLETALTGLRHGVRTTFRAGACFHTRHDEAAAGNGPQPGKPAGETGREGTRRRRKAGPRQASPAAPHRRSATAIA